MKGKKKSEYANQFVDLLEVNYYKSTVCNRLNSRQKFHCTYATVTLLTSITL